jgi:hypothetical protein
MPQLVNFPQIPSKYDVGTHTKTQGLQANTFSSPQIPPLRVGTPFRFSRIFLNFAAGSESLDEPPLSVQTNHLEEILTPKVELPQSSDGCNDALPSNSFTGASLQKVDAVVFEQLPAHQDYPRQIRRMKGYQDLRAAAATSSHITPSHVAPISFQSLV